MKQRRRQAILEKRTPEHAIDNISEPIHVPLSFRQCLFFYLIVSDRRERGVGVDTGTWTAGTSSGGRLELDVVEVDRRLKIVCLLSCIVCSCPFSSGVRFALLPFFLSVFRFVVCSICLSSCPSLALALCIIFFLSSRLSCLSDFCFCWPSR